MFELLNRFSFVTAFLDPQHQSQPSFNYFKSQVWGRTEDSMQMVETAEQRQTGVNYSMQPRSQNTAESI